MTYLINARKSINAGLNLYESASVTSLANDQTVSFSQTLHSMGSSYNFTLSFDGSTFTLPNDNYTYLFEGALVWYGSNSAGAYKYGFYDVTNSTFVGTYGHITSGMNSSEGTIGSLVADEMAIFATDQAIDLELRLISSVNNYSSMLGVDWAITSSNQNLISYFNKARLIVRRY